MHTLIADFNHSIQLSSDCVKILAHQAEYTFWWISESYIRQMYFPSQKIKHNKNVIQNVDRIVVRKYFYPDFE